MTTFLLLAVFGAFLGMVVNWGIYQLCYFREYPISPFQLRHLTTFARQGWDYLPVVGWLALRRFEGVHGKFFWVRPLLIELGFSLFTPWFYEWQLSGGLIDQRIPIAAGQGQLWFGLHLALISLLATATFIDFDEQTIPDAITLPGTWLALIAASFFPDMRLPELVSGPTYHPIDFCSPDAITQVSWHRDWRGLAAGLLVLNVWAVALMPKLTTWRFGLLRGIQLMWASLVFPRRRVKGRLTGTRGPQPATWALSAMAFLGSCYLIWFWYRQGPPFESLLGSLLGMAFAGGLIWAIRLLASGAIGREAMGFGDVTLMIMIGAYLGWQAALPILFYAPFAGALVGLIQFLVTKNNAFAFGPYLSIAAIVVLFRWQSTWDYLQPYYQGQMRNLMFLVIIGSLIALPVLLRLVAGNRASQVE